MPGRTWLHSSFSVPFYSQQQGFFVISGLFILDFPGFFGDFLDFLDF
jgi:hypothetical protein